MYVCTMELDSNICYKRNIHNRTLEDIQVISSRFFPTPVHHIHLDPTTLLQSAAIPDVQMEDAIDDDVITIEEDTADTEVREWLKLPRIWKTADLSNGNIYDARSSKFPLRNTYRTIITMICMFYAMFGTLHYVNVFLLITVTIDNTFLGI